MSGRPNTKAKVESPMKLIDEIMSYNGLLEDFTELESKIEIMLQLIPMLLFQGNQ